MWTWIQYLTGNYSDLRVFNEGKKKKHEYQLDKHIYNMKYAILFRPQLSVLPYVVSLSQIRIIQYQNSTKTLVG